MKPTLDDLRMAAYRAGYEIKTSEKINQLGVLAITDSTERIIWLSEGLAGRRLRSTLAHETVHGQLDHTGPRQDRGEDLWRGSEEPWLDDAVDVLAAGRMFSEADYLAALAAGNPAGGRPTWAIVARRLGVDAQMLKNWWSARKVALGEVSYSK